MGGSAVAPAAVAAALMMGLAACAAGHPPATGPTGDPSPSAAPVTPPPTPSLLLDPEQAAAADEILAAYHGFREAEAALHAHPVEPDTATARLAPYVVEPLLSRVNWSVYNLHLHGLARAGQSTSEPRLVDLRLDERPPSATIRDCLDTTGWRLVERASGEPATADDVTGLYAAAPDRHVRDLTVVLYPTGWRLEDASWHPEETC